ncbi:unnamed protein product [Ceratitis capitata]|uniref:(Mediterranean fruit fly) hypothetical protein n=1 Tax=Ceratitis capitata TaxID=7213 RepID=A0A811V8X5_CERCA|nr:unnamed protein product [Ceratitis capitata]
MCICTLCVCPDRVPKMCILSTFNNVSNEYTRKSASSTLPTYIHMYILDIPSSTQPKAALNLLFVCTKLTIWLGVPRASQLRPDFPQLYFLFWYFKAIKTMFGDVSV